MASAAKGMQSAGNAAGGAAKQMERPGRRWLDSTRLRRWKPRMPAQAVAGAVELAAQTSITMPPWIWTQARSTKSWRAFLMFEAAWDSQGEKVVASMKSAFTSVKALAGSIGDSFYEVFTNGTGQQTLESILSIFSNIMGCADKFAERLKAAWDDNGNGLRLYRPGGIS